MLDRMSGSNRSTSIGKHEDNSVDDACERARRELEKGKADAGSIADVVGMIRELGLTGDRPALVVACKPQSDTLPAALRVLVETGSLTAARAVALMGCSPAGPLCVSDDQGERAFGVFVREPMARGADMTRLLPMSGWDFHDKPRDSDLSKNVVLRSHGSVVSEECVFLGDVYATLFGCDDPVAALERIGFDKAALMCALRCYSECSDYYAWAGSDRVMRMLADSGDAFDSRMDTILDLLDGGDGHGDIRDVVVPVGMTVASIAEGLPASFIMEDLRRGPSRLAYIRRAENVNERISSLILGGDFLTYFVSGILGFGTNYHVFFMEAARNGGYPDPTLDDFYGWQDVRYLTRESIRHGNHLLDLLEAVPEGIWALVYHDCQTGYIAGFVPDNSYDVHDSRISPDQDPEWAEQVLSAGVDATYRWMVWTHVQHELIDTPYRYSKAVPRIGRRYALKGRLPSPESNLAVKNPELTGLIAGMLANVPVSWDVFMQAMADSGTDDADAVLTGMMEEGIGGQENVQYADPAVMHDSSAAMLGQSDGQVVGSV